LWGREEELRLLSGELLVHRGEGLQLAFYVRLILLVQKYFEEAGVIEAESSPLANDIGGKYEIVQNGIVNGGQGSTSWSLLSLDVIGFSGLRQDLALADDYDLLAAELLLELSDQTRLNFVEVGEELVWHKNNNCSFSTIAKRNFFGGGDEKIAEVSSEVGRSILDVSQGCSDSFLC